MTRPTYRRRAVIALAAVAATLAAAGCGAAEEQDVVAEQQATVLEMLDGLPQEDITLGEEGADNALTIYSSLTDWDNSRFARETLPRIIDRYVRPGTLRLRLRTVAEDSEDAVSGGEDARRAALAAQAAAEQDRLWQFFGVLSARYVGYFDEAELRGALEAVPGLDVEQALADTRSATVRTEVDDIGRAATEAGVQAPPTFFLKLGGKPSEPLPSNDPPAVLKVLERELEPVG